MADLSDLQARAQSYELSGDSAFDDDLRAHLDEVEGRGWSLATSWSLDRRDDARGRPVAWWLVGRGATVCSLDLPVVGPSGEPTSLGRAVGPRTGLSPDRFDAPDHAVEDLLESLPDARVDVVAVTEREIVLLAEHRRPEGADGDLALEEVGVDALAPLVFAGEAWEPPSGYAVGRWVAVSPAAGAEPERPRLVGVEPERSVEGEWGEFVDTPGRFVRLREGGALPGTDGPLPGDVRIHGPPADALRSVPPCRGALVGACLLDLVETQQGASGLGVVELGPLWDRVADALAIDPSLADAPFQEVVESNPLISSFKLGDTVYPYLSPGGIVRAADLSRRLGGSITPEEALAMMDRQNANIASTIKQIQHRSRRGDLSPFFGGDR